MNVTDITNTRQARARGCGRETMRRENKMKEGGGKSEIIRRKTRAGRRQAQDQSIGENLNTFQALLCSKQKSLRQRREK